MLHLGVVEGFLQRIDRPARHPGFVHDLDPFGRRFRLRHPLDVGVQRLPVLDAPVRGVVFRPRRQLRGTEGAAWKSSKKIIASISDACTHWPSPESSRSSNAVRIPLAQSRPAPTSESAAPERIGPRPGSPVTIIWPPIPCTMGSTPGRSTYGPSWPNPAMLA